MEKLEAPTFNFLNDVPDDVLFQSFLYLNDTDLKNVALGNVRLKGIVERVQTYKRNVQDKVNKAFTDLLSSEAFKSFKGRTTFFIVNEDIENLPIDQTFRRKSIQSYEILFLHRIIYFTGYFNNSSTSITLTFYVDETKANEGKIQWSNDNQHYTVFEALEMLKKQLIEKSKSTNKGKSHYEIEPQKTKVYAYIGIPDNTENTIAELFVNHPNRRIHQKGILNENYIQLNDFRYIFNLINRSCNEPHIQEQKALINNMYNQYGMYGYFAFDKPKNDSEIKPLFETINNAREYITKVESVIQELLVGITPPNPFNLPKQGGKPKIQYTLTKEKIKTKSGMRSVYVSKRNTKYIKLDGKWKRV